MTTIAEIKRANKAAGHYFFSRATMRGFNSRIEPRTYPAPDGRHVYFVTSEQFEDSRGYHSPRAWTVRVFDKSNGHVWTPSDVGKFNASSDAHRAAADLASRTEELL